MLTVEAHNIERQLPKSRLDSDYLRTESTRRRLEPAFAPFGAAPPEPQRGEAERDYRCRALRAISKFSVYRGQDLARVDNLDLAERVIVGAARSHFNHTLQHGDELVRADFQDAEGRRVTEHFGHASRWLAEAGGQTTVRVVNRFRRNDGDHDDPNSWTKDLIPSVRAAKLDAQIRDLQRQRGAMGR